jgi:hypothetical protein
MWRKIGVFHRKMLDLSYPRGSYQYVERIVDNLGRRNEK